MQKGLNYSVTQVASGCGWFGVLIWTLAIGICVLKPSTGLPHSPFLSIAPLTSWGPTSLTVAWNLFSDHILVESSSREPGVQPFVTPMRRRAGKSLCRFPEPATAGLTDMRVLTSRPVPCHHSLPWCWQVQLVLKPGAAFYVEKILFWNLGWSKTPASEDLPCAVQRIQTGPFPTQTARRNWVPGVYLHICLLKKK